MSSGSEQAVPTMVRDRNYRRPWTVTALRAAVFSVTFAVGFVIAEGLMVLFSNEGVWGEDATYRGWAPFVAVAWLLVGGVLIDHFGCRMGQTLLVVLHSAGVAFTAAAWSDLVTEPQPITANGPGFDGLDSIGFVVAVVPIFALVAAVAVLAAGVVQGSFPAWVPSRSA